MSDIEDSFNKASEIEFRLALVEKALDAVFLRFINPSEGIDEYYSLAKEFKNEPCTLVVYDRNSHIDISIVNDKTHEIINVKNLNFDRKEFEQFCHFVPTSQRILFSIGHEGDSTDVIDSRKQRLFFNRYNLVK